MLGCGNGIRDGSVCRYDDDAQAGRAGLQFLEQANAVHLVHSEVGNNQVRAETIHGGECFVSRFHGLYIESLGTKTNTQEAKQSRVVVNEQDLAFGRVGFGLHGSIIVHLPHNVKEKRARSRVYSCSRIDCSIEVMASSFSSASSRSLRRRRFSASTVLSRWLSACFSVRAARELDSRRRRASLLATIRRSALFRWIVASDNSAGVRS